MQEIVRRYKDPIGVVLGSHSALDALAGLRNYGIKGLVYTTRYRAEIYLREHRVGRIREIVDELPKFVRRDVIVTEDIADIKRRAKEPWTEAILILDRYDDILKPENLDSLVELEGIQIPNRAFSVYVGGRACERIERDFSVPIIGSRQLLKIENREEVEKNYYWYLEKARIPHPRSFPFEVTEEGIKLLEEVDRPVVLKAPHAGRRLERAFVFAADRERLEEIEKEIEAKRLLKEDLEGSRVEEYISGVTANFNFFYSPINAEEDWGEIEKYVDRWRLANEFLSIDERRE